MEEQNNSDSSSSDTDSSSSSNSPAPAKQAEPQAGPSRKRKMSRKTTKAKRKRRDDTVNNLTKEVSELKQFLSSMYPQPMPIHPTPPFTCPSDCDDDVSLNVSGELFPGGEGNSEDKRTTLVDLSINLPFNTTVKEPVIPKSSQTHIDFLNSIQHFGSSDWADIRYSEVQKGYCSTPGFVDSECNDELKPYDKITSLSITEKGFAAITQALIKQKESMQSGLESLLAWVSSCNDLTVSALKTKLNEIFIEGSYNKISVDLLQMVCGHRADLIQQRRDNILKYVKDKYIRGAIRKIPPTCDLLFDKVMLSSELEKTGGVSKTFWPLRNATSFKSNWPAAQAGPSHAKPPTQGVREYPAKSSFGRYMTSQPAQGAPLYPYPAQGYYMNQPLPLQPYYMPKRFAQNRDYKHGNKSNVSKTRQKSRFDDYSNRNNSKNNRDGKHFHGKRKF